MNDIKIEPVGSLLVSRNHNLIDPYTIRFFFEEKEVGCFDFGKSPITFVGDVDESARIFVDTVIKMMPYPIQLT